MYTDASDDSNAVLKRYHYLSMRYQAFLDRLNGKRLVRWLIFFSLLSIYFFRVFYWNGWYIVTYALGIFYLNLFIAFLSPQVDPELEDDYDSYDTADALPSSVSSSRNFTRRSNSSGDEGEFRPFIRRLPEFKFWYSCTKAILIALFFTTSRAFDIPVYYPILLGYFIILFVLTMRKQIQHMIKYKYVPFTIGKKKYKPTATASIYSTLDKIGTGGNNAASFVPTSVAVASAYQPPKSFQPTPQNVQNVNVYQPTGPFTSSPLVTPTSEFRQVSLSPPPTSTTSTLMPTKTGKRD